MNLDDFVRRADALIAQCDTMTSRAQQDVFKRQIVLDGLYGQFRSATLSFIKNVYGEGHPYFSEFSRLCNDTLLTSAQAGQGVLRAIRDELAGGWIRTTTGLVSGAIFADFLEMAAHLLDEKYKDAAAVIAGSALEEHLRHLSSARGLPVEKAEEGRLLALKADFLNSALASAKAYEKLDQKSVTAWLDLRNKAAHGHYDDYTIDQVRLMVDGIRNFLLRNPA
jgi:hypothetical protein